MKQKNFKIINNLNESYISELKKISKLGLQTDKNKIFSNLIKDDVLTIIDSMKTNSKNKFDQYIKNNKKLISNLFKKYKEWDSGAFKYNVKLMNYIIFNIDKKFNNLNNTNKNYIFKLLKDKLKLDIGEKSLNLIITNHLKENSIINLILYYQSLKDNLINEYKNNNFSFLRYCKDNKIDFDKANNYIYHKMINMINESLDNQIDQYFIKNINQYNNKAYVDNCISFLNRKYEMLLSL